MVVYCAGQIDSPSPAGCPDDATRRAAFHAGSRIIPDVRRPGIRLFVIIFLILSAS